MYRSSLIVGSTVLFLILGLAMLGSANAQPNTQSELIVLLAHDTDAPTPWETVEGIRRGRGVDPVFLVGNPTGARPGLALRAGGALLARLQAEPNSPRARLERYIVVTYPESANLDAIIQGLERNPHVEHVDRNSEVQVSILPNDTFRPDQWALASLNLYNGWNRGKGHAYVGIIDLGFQVDHPDLRAHPVYLERTIPGDNGALKTICQYQNGAFEGGNFRPQFSWDFFEGDCNVDSEDPADPDGFFGHGTHVAGIVGATANNNQGVAGVCWNCSLMIAKGGQGFFSFDTGAAALTFLVDRGAQVVNMSWGAANTSCGTSELAMLCQALQYAQDRDVVLVAAAGNNKTNIQFPASDSRVMSIGGIESNGSFWDESDNGGCPRSDNLECGSNYRVTPGTATQDLVTPARQVLSTIDEGHDWNPALGCGDSTFPGAVGYGYCTGTSMASPHAAGLAGLIRSVNPLLSKSQVRDALIKNASLGGQAQPDPKLGFGVPNIPASLDATLGSAAGSVMKNRLTPLFSLFSGSSQAATHLFTTVPQMATAALFDSEVTFGTFTQSPVRPPITPDYAQFPDAPCSGLNCEREPRASIYIFTTDQAPFPSAPPLVPLYRMSFDEPWNGNNKNRSYSYTTETAGVEALKSAGYEVDGIEGYIYQRCTPEPSCIPSDTERLFRLYNGTLDDYALVPESEEAAFRNNGYISPSGLNDQIGYVYPNVDGDSDGVIDGFELLVGTDPGRDDSDCDGLSDREEILVYDSDGYGDPLDGVCAGPDVVIRDGFFGTGPLNGRTTDEGGAVWAARSGAGLGGGAVRDLAAIGAVAINPGSSGTLRFQLDVNPTSAQYVGAGFASTSYNAYTQAGQLWVSLGPAGSYTVYFNRTTTVLASGSIPGSPAGGYHRVEIFYVLETRLATVDLNGVQVVSQVLPSAPAISYAGFNMHGATEGSSVVDNLLLEVPTAYSTILIHDTFSGLGALDGRITASGNAQWIGSDGAGVRAGRGLDIAAIAGVPFDSATHGGERSLTLSADVNPTGAQYIFAGFANSATQEYFSAGRLWVAVGSAGDYVAVANGVTLGTGSIPGTPSKSYHHLEIQYNTQTRVAKVLLNGVQVVSKALESAPDIRFAGFHMLGATQGQSRLDNFEVRSIGLP